MPYKSHLLERLEYAIRKAQGICVDCGRVATSGRLCRRCYTRRQTYRRKYWGAEPTHRKCTICREPGHYRTTCPEKNK